MAKTRRKKKTPAVAARLEPRVRKATRRQRRKADKSTAKQRGLIGSFRLVRLSLGTLQKHWKILGGIVLVYLVLNIIFASGISNLSSGIATLKDNLATSGGHKFWAALGSFSSIVGSGGASGSATGSTLQLALIILESLVVIWALRQLLADKTTGVRQAYYSATAPLVPFLLVLVVVLIQLLPLTAGASIVGAILSSAIFSGAALSIIFAVILFGLGLWSAYMVSSSIFALYIVTLPEMTPLRALRSAKNLVRFRRWKVMRRVLFLPLATLAIIAAIIIPLIYISTFLVVPVFYVLSTGSILFVHTYLYSLYRELLNEG